MPSSTAFTLTEIIVVLGIIVVLLALAVPAFRAITGSRSTEAAANTLSALLGRARGIALGLQKDAGVLFYIDPASGRVAGALVQQVERPTSGASNNVDVYVDLVVGEDPLFLPPGVMLQVVDDCTLASGARQDDGYIGFNDASGGANGSALFGGVILFDGGGKLVSRRYGFGTGGASEINTLLKPISNPYNPPSASAKNLQSQFGFVLFDREAFIGAGWNLDDPQPFNSGYTPDESREEDWIDANADPYIINRYNGTLIRGQ